MPFPALELLDSFKRAAENPLSNGGKWSLIGGATKTGKVVTEEYASSDTFSTLDAAYWNPKTIKSPAVSLEYRSGLTTERYGRLYAALSEPGSAANISGYSLQWKCTAAGKITLILEKINKSVHSTLAEKASVVIGAGDKLGLTVGGGKVKAWFKKSGGEWEEVLSVEDSSYTEGSVGLGAAGNLHFYNNFEAAQSGIGEEPTTTQGSSASLTKTVSRALATGAEQSASLSTEHLIAQPLSTTQGSSATLDTPSISRILSVARTQAAKLKAAIARALSAMQAQAVSLESDHHQAATQGQQATLTRQVSRTLKVGQGQHAHMEGPPEDFCFEPEWLYVEKPSTPKDLLVDASNIRWFFSYTLGGFGEADISGESPLDLWIKSKQSAPFYATHAETGGYLYWITVTGSLLGSNRTFWITRANLSASPTIEYEWFRIGNEKEAPILSGSVQFPSSMVTDGTYLYLGFAHSIMRFNIATKTLEGEWLKGKEEYKGGHPAENASFRALAIGGGYIYWSVPEGIARAKDDATEINENWYRNPALAGVSSLALDSEHLWFGTQGAPLLLRGGIPIIGRLLLDASYAERVPPTTLVVGTKDGKTIFHIAIDATYLYWSWYTKYIGRWCLDDILFEEIPPLTKEEEKEKEKEEEEEGGGKEEKEKEKEKGEEEAEEKKEKEKQEEKEKEEKEKEVEKEEKEEEELPPPEEGEGEGEGGGGGGIVEPPSPTALSLSTPGIVRYGRRVP